MLVQFDPYPLLGVGPDYVRPLIHALCQHFIPPLRVEDCIALLAKHLAAQRLYLPGASVRRLPVRNIVAWDDVAMLAIVCADHELATQARFLPGRWISVSVASMLHWPTDAFHAWNLSECQSAIDAYLIPPEMKPKRITEADLATRQGMIAFQMREISKHSKLQFSREHVFESVREELAENLGDPGDVEEFPNKVVSGYLRMIAKIRIDDEPMFGVLPDGRLTADKPTIRDELRSALGKGVGRKIAKGRGRRKTLELSRPLRRKKTSDDSKSNVTLEDTVAASTPNPSEYLSLRELRDLRDGLGDHLLVQQLADVVLASGDAPFAGEVVARLLPLATLLRAHEDRALQAALIFEWSRGGRARSHGTWKRTDVAQAYGVTARRVEEAGRRAKLLLGYSEAA